MLGMVGNGGKERVRKGGKGANHPIFMKTDMVDTIR